MGGRVQLLTLLPERGRVRWLVKNKINSVNDFYILCTIPIASVFTRGFLNLKGENVVQRYNIFYKNRNKHK